MGNLITRLRVLTQAGTADFSVAGVTYFTDNQLEDRLDAHATLLEGMALTWLPDTVAGGAASYHRVKQGWRDLEEAESGTIYHRITDSLGNVQGTAGYTGDYVRGEFRFTANQGGTAYYLTSRSYDLYAAAKDVWEEKASYYSDWYKFSSEGQAFERQQAYEHALKQAERLGQKAGSNSGAGEFRSNVFARNDLNPRR
jgi:hypothetical protein